MSAPDSASLISGGNWNWLNVANAPVTLNEALTGLNADDDGMANPDAGTVVEVVFNSGVVNGTGADLVILDAQFDIGFYLISCDYDGFVASTVADHSSGLNVASTGYYFQFAGPYSADITGVEVDLSNMSVPAGATVNAVRFTCVNTGCDPIGLCRLGSGGPTLAVTNLVAGSQASLSVTGATPNGLVAYAYSLTGAGPTALPNSLCPALTLSLSNPIHRIGSISADASGAATLSQTVPPNAALLQINLQALDLTTCEVTNVVTAFIQ